MKISIILPAQNSPEYLKQVLPYLKAHTTPEELKEILIVEEMETDQLVKLAEKSHAKLFVFKDSSQSLKAEAGAFMANGDILYFIKPGHFPPPYFAKRIIAAVSLKNKLGSLYHPIIAMICKSCNLVWLDRMVIFMSPISNFFILRDYFYQKGGLKYDGKTYSFQEFLNKRDFKSTLGLIQ